MLFYTVDTASPVFLQLKQAGLPSQATLETERDILQTTAPSPTAPYLASTGRMGLQAGEPAEGPLSSPSRPSPLTAPTPVTLAVAAVEQRDAPPAPDQLRTSNVFSDPLPPPALVGVATVGLGLMMIVTSLFYLRMTSQQRLASHVSQALSNHASAVTVVVSPHAPSGAMHSTRWRVVPGGFGGFDPGASTSESY